jgi:predicted small lipoprotein YifL
LSASALASVADIRSTEIMKRIGMFAIVTLLAAAGCGSQAPAATPPAKSAGSTSTSAGSASATPTSSVSPTTVIEFTVDGAGPYQLGATLSVLQAAKSLDAVTAGGTACPENTTARGTGTWKDVELSFHKDGKLYLAVNRSSSIPTPSGAWLGTTLAELKTVYAGVSGQDIARGAGSAYLVTTLSGRGILFDLDPNKKVIAMLAGDANFLKVTYVGGGNFC